MEPIPLIDWNGNGTIDPDDIAISLAMSEEAQANEDYEDEDTTDSLSPSDHL